MMKYKFVIEERQTAEVEKTFKRVSQVVGLTISNWLDVTLVYFYRLLDHQERLDVASGMRVHDSPSRAMPDNDEYQKRDDTKHDCLAEEVHAH